MPDSPTFLTLLAEAQHRLDEGFAHLPAAAVPPLPPGSAAVLAEAATRMHDNYPYAHPLYAGQMLKPPHPVARAAYALAMSLNPNNHALGGKGTLRRFCKCRLLGVVFFCFRMEICLDTCGC